MLFSEYMSSIENTEQETKLIETLAEVKNVPAWTSNIPLVGKIIGTLVALAESESIEAFRETDQYDYIKDWNVKIHDPESGAISITPSDGIMRKIAIAFAFISAVLFTLWVNKKISRMRTKRSLNS